MAEFNSKLEKDVNNKKLVFLDQYLKENNISTTNYKLGYLPLLMAFNQHSRSTPAHLVHALNRPGICLNLKSNDVLSQEDQNLGISLDPTNCTDY